MGGLETHMCTSFAPASFSIFTILPLVVPRTMLSSTMMTDLPFTAALMALSFSFTAVSRFFWVGWIKVRPI